jgi:hypothetical protein
MMRHSWGVFRAKPQTCAQSNGIRLSAKGNYSDLAVAHIARFLRACDFVCSGSGWERKRVTTRTPFRSIV